MTTDKEKPPEKRSTSVIRWAGSKRKILPTLRDAFLKSGATGKYVEPFVGSAALFFDLGPADAVLSDTNAELISALTELKSNPSNLFNLLSDLQADPETYYRLRGDSVDEMNSTQRAVRFFYLNRNCFNGIYRTNKKGEFNVPYGGEKSGRLPSIEKWIQCSTLLDRAELRCEDFFSIIDSCVSKNDFVYLDPPYAVSNRRIFKQYSASEFGVDDVRRLNDALQIIESRGAKFLVSYAQSPETSLISTGWNIKRKMAQRNVAGFAKHRRKAVEVLISNF